MNSPEVFYLHIGGEQRGPYTVAHIDHLLHSGLIAEETLFWRDGLEQWQPVTSLVIRRKVVRRWIKPAILAAVCVVLAVVVRVLWPTIVVGWRETDQREFTAHAAYWRARDTVRQRGVPTGTFVIFSGVHAAQVQMLPAPLSRASVRLRGELREGHRQGRAAAWDVVLRYEPDAKQWTGVSVKEVPPEV